ncbi:enoyl-CoA hydratase-related protein [Nocardioides sp.]|uniref:enoyl-CoA hydratase-related protein n=1 Tax=Nocardioides sp. TaxID=35761 RepID=UPI0039E417B6
MTENLIERHAADGVLTLVLNRPGRRNAFDRALTDALSDALDELDDDPQHRVGVLAANGPVFSAGTDLHEPASPATPRGGEYGVIRRSRRKPLIAAVEGPALGGGFEIVLACDLVVADTRVGFGLPEVARGVVASCGGLFRTPDRLAPNLAAELVLTGDAISAERAAAVGLVNLLCEPGGARAAAYALAARIIKNSPNAVTASLRALAEARWPAEGAGWPATRAAVAAIEHHPERAEGIAAFFERRPPSWAV